MTSKTLLSMLEALRKNILAIPPTETVWFEGYYDQIDELISSLITKVKKMCLTDTDIPLFGEVFKTVIMTGKHYGKETDEIELMQKNVMPKLKFFSGKKPELVEYIKRTKLGDMAVKELRKGGKELSRCPACGVMTHTIRVNDVSSLAYVCGKCGGVKP